ncbi:MAG: peptidoglycan-binding protein [Heteroscytonema crispum UTEX LB 1556]
MEAVDLTAILDASANSISMPALVEGAKGDAVTFLQRLLNNYRGKIKQNQNKYPALKVDGQFGPQTKATVIKFQREYRDDPILDPDGTFSVDGKVGPLTWRALSNFCYNRCTVNK